MIGTLTEGGGVAFYIKDNINYKVRTDITPCNLEIMVIEITKPKVKPFLITSWYPEIAI